MQPWVRRGVLDRTTRRQPPKSEIRGPKPERRPNTEGRSHLRAFRISGFGLLSALGFRASGLGLCAHGLVALSSYVRRGGSVIRAWNAGGDSPIPWIVPLLVLYWSSTS